MCLVGEGEPPPPPSNDQLIESALSHPEDHGAAVGIGGEDSSDEIDGASDCEDEFVDCESDDELPTSRPRQAPKLSGRQIEFCKECTLLLLLSS